MRLARLMALVAVAGLVALALTNSTSAGRTRPARPADTTDLLSPAVARKGIHKIRHVVIIMQENRSFDNYFGTYPHADGIPGLAGHPGKVPCLPNPGKHCVRPFHDRYNVNLGGPYVSTSAIADIDGGKMDGFVREQESRERQLGMKSKPPHDVMGYHTRADIPNYWKYAKHYVLQDHMFESVSSYSLPSHMYLTSLWSAYCKKHNHPASCKNATDNVAHPPGFSGAKKKPVYAWTDLTYLLHKHHVSWRYYMFNGTEPLCDSNANRGCQPVRNGPTSLPIWYPLKWFDTVHDDHQASNVESVKHFFQAARKGKLPAVSWIAPSTQVSEHPTGWVSVGETYVTGLINAVMRSRDWKSTAIFVTWDDWSGFYDNVVPPHLDENGYGLRVPGLVISPYAKKGYIDHQILSFDAYAKFIEDDFLGGARLNPKTDGRPDPRPDVRENAKILGNLVKDFNFKQRPRKPMILPVEPKTDLIDPSGTSALPPNGGFGWW